MRNQVDEVLVALADPIRRQVVDELRLGPRRAGELADAAGMSFPAISRHLRVLRASNLVEVRALEEDARVRVYQLRAEPFLALRAWLDQVEAFWTDQLGAFSDYANKRKQE
ncbi:ArsR/SmtB family transcription factor [Actinophytocola oryzae]|uniref:ArsR/SmtB family transcription factor n=1 Tax=Actinophytocola oryzae TaxID=502181 RepID=UPI0010629747|nr:metalloregulator ArsR/SmtB family transcription factor [Actinophytocola oryzae]